MARLVLCVLALLVAGGSADLVKTVLPHKVADEGQLHKQLDLMLLFYHPHEPTCIEKQKTAASTWTIEKNLSHYNNVTAAKITVRLLKHGVLPKGVPFTIHESYHRFEAQTFFNLLFSAKDYQTFYNTAAYLRKYINEYLFVYVCSIAIIHRPDTQGVVIPPIYNLFPSYFFNGEVLNTAQRINTHGSNWIDYYPTTHLMNEKVVINWNNTVWPYIDSEMDVTYFTHDHGLNTFYYNQHLTYPGWVGSNVIPLIKDRRGEWFWFLHKEIVTRYYMERLSNGLGEIPELDFNVVKEGYNSGLLYWNGIPYPQRPNYFNLNQPEYVEKVLLLKEYETRIRQTVDQGYYINAQGERVNIRTPEAIDVLGRLIEAGADSPNNHYYKNFISLWKTVLGNTQTHQHHYYQNEIPLVVPSVLEHYQTALRDPAFYMIWKRVLNIFSDWQRQLPPYKKEELALPTVTIQNVEVDKLLTYFENTYINVTNDLHMNDNERNTMTKENSVLVQKPQLNHKVFQVRVNVKSEVAKTVIVRFFLGPKYDSRGFEIPLDVNSDNFFLFDLFTYDLPQGETIIQRDSVDNLYTAKKWSSAMDLYWKAQNALNGKGQFILDQTETFVGMPHRILLPKGRVGGMPFVFFVHISEYHAPKVPHGTGFDPAVSLGLGSGARYITDMPIGYPFDRPLHTWQIEGLHNMWQEDVMIYHKETPEVNYPYSE